MYVSEMEGTVIAMGGTKLLFIFSENHKYWLFTTPAHHPGVRKCLLAQGRQQQPSSPMKI